MRSHSNFGHFYLACHNMQANKDTDRNHIDYIIPAVSERQKEYANFIARECILHGIRIDVSNNVEDMQSALRLAVAMEKYIKFLKNVRQWSDSGREFVPLVELVELLIPCILHLENRVGEKIISIIIKKGTDLYDLGRKEDFIEQLSKTFQTQVFGTVESPSQWKLRYSKDGGHLTLYAIQLRNNATRCCLDTIDVIIEQCVAHDETLCGRLILATTKYREALKLLLLHHELSDDEIENFQDLIDDFFEKWGRNFW